MTKGRRLFNALLPILIVFLVSVIAIMCYLLIVTQSIWNQSVADIMEVTDQGRHAFDIYVSKENELIHYLSLQYSQIDSTDVESIQGNIKSLSELTPDYFVINLESEKVYSNHFDYLPNLSKEKLEKYSTNTDSIISPPEDSDFTGARVLSCYKIFYFADGVKGLVRTEHKISNIVAEFSLSFYDGYGYSNIIDNDGKILIRSNNIDDNRTYNNLFEVIDRADNSTSDLKQFKQALSDDESGVIRFNGQNGKQYVYTYIPLQKVDGWYFISIIPNDVIMEYTRSVLVTPELIGITVAFCLIIIAVLVIEVLIHNMMIKRKEKESGFLVTFMSDLSENTNTVFMMLDVKDFSVQYVSKNSEKVLGVSSKNIKTNILAIDTVNTEDEPAINFDLFREVTTERPISFNLTKTHSVSGETLKLKETIYRVTGNDTEHLLVVIAKRQKRSLT